MRSLNQTKHAGLALRACTALAEDPQLPAAAAPRGLDVCGPVGTYTHMCMPTHTHTYTVNIFKNLFEK